MRAKRLVFCIQAGIEYMGYPTYKKTHPTRTLP